MKFTNTSSCDHHLEVNQIQLLKTDTFLQNFALLNFQCKLSIDVK